MAITLHNLNGGEIALVGDIGEPPPEGLERLYRLMLEGNRLFGGTGGATISLDAERDRFALVKVFDCGGLDAAAFTEAVSKFASVLETWVKLVANWRFSPDEDAAQQDASDPADGFILM